MATTTPTSTQGGSTGAAQIQNTLQSLVQALNNAAQTLANINGVSNVPAITAPTVVKNSSGRICEISILVAGTAPGTVYDSAATTDISKPLFLIPNIDGVFKSNWPVTLGVMVVPGTGQTVSVTFS